MNRDSLRQLFEQVKSGALGVDDGMDRLKHLPFEDLSFAKIDHHRALRCGFPEVIYCEGKTTEQIAAIFEKCADTGVNVLATRADQQAYEAIHNILPEAEHYELARCITLRQTEAKKSTGTIAVVSAGTADLPVAEEACVTAEIMDQTVVTFYDVGVAGIHRLLAHTADIQDATVIVVVAGMEGALPSVVGGLVSAPVIAVPTSVGYGASFGGLAALLGMLNSCANNIAVVNIDNGFGAGYLASTINRLAERSPAPD